MCSEGLKTRLFELACGGIPLAASGFSAPRLRGAARALSRNPLFSRLSRIRALSKALETRGFGRFEEFRHAASRILETARKQGSTNSVVVALLFSKPLVSGGFRLVPRLMLALLTFTKPLVSKAFPTNSTTCLTVGAGWERVGGVGTVPTGAPRRRPAKHRATVRPLSREKRRTLCPGRHWNPTRCVARMVRATRRATHAPPGAAPDATRREARSRGATLRGVSGDRCPSAAPSESRGMEVAR